MHDICVAALFTHQITVSSVMESQCMCKEKCDEQIGANERNKMKGRKTQQRTIEKNSAKKNHRMI